ncbi:MAG: hypothetical protein DWQ04_26405 [Chloroflexi bacterium]|nr:MAG: hypothetical protein DWQ04_26405 [Chloroflexota bacterium]
MFEYSRLFGEGNGRSAYEVMSMSRAQVMLEELFTMENLKTPCFDLGMDYEKLGCDNKEELTRELVGACSRRQPSGGVTGGGGVEELSIANVGGETVWRPRKGSGAV